MKFIVVSREEAERGLLVREPYVVISIRDPGRPKPRIPRPGHCRAVLYLAFHDAEPSPALALPKEIRAMTPEDAEAIRQFFQEHRPHIGAVVVHCEQGMSRSPAVARALAHAAGGDATYFDRHYQPNPYVCRLLSDALEQRQRRTNGMDSDNAEAGTIPQPPTKFDLQPFAGRWFRWAEIDACFWTRGKGMQVNPALYPVRRGGGVYLLAWSRQAPSTFRPDDRAIQYVGETGDFCNRMDRFRTSAGIRWQERYKGHSAAYRWPLGKTEHLWVGFFPIRTGLQPHLAEGMRVWMEAVAQEEYRLAHGDVPPLNRSGKAVIPLDEFITPG